MSKKKLPSPVIQLLDLVWENANKGTDHTWQRLNGAMRGALELVVMAGFSFELGDYRHILDSYRTGYWIGESDEWVYSLAIEVDNATVYNSFEQCRERKPFIADDVGRHSADRAKSRLAVGLSFTYHGFRPTVTSFAADHLTACTYKDSRKIDRRFKITHADIIAERAERQERSTLLDQLTKVATDPGSKVTAATILKSIGAKTTADFARVPIDKIRKVAAKFAKAS